MLKVGIKGKVLSGRYMGWHIMIERDSEAYYLFLAENENPKAGFDEWFRNYEELVNIRNKEKGQVTPSPELGQ
jgi:hypothetical protein